MNGQYGDAYDRYVGHGVSVDEVVAMGQAAVTEQVIELGGTQEEADAIWQYAWESYNILTGR